MKLTYLGGITTAHFLRNYWQKKPLLIKQAFPAFPGIIEPEGLFRLACRDDVEARLVSYIGSKWQLNHGPFKQKVFANAKKRDWTLLVQDVNHFLPEAAVLLQRFDFIPHARLDDLMVSYAAAGGGVGPHFDSYDVFLLQGAGKRRWRISGQKNLELVPDAPLKILKAFQPEMEWVLESGDMLYLPPGYAHEGVAITQCITYSIGFRAPSNQELTNAFLTHLQDHLSPEGRYEDPDLTETKHPGNISKRMVNKAVATLKNIQWTKMDVADFLGAYLSEPKPHVFFIQPEDPWPKSRFASTVRKFGLKLALKSRMLYRENVFYLNGERFEAPEASIIILQQLADKRSVEAEQNVDDKTMLVLWKWYCAGYVEPIVTTTTKNTKQKWALHDDRRPTWDPT